ncbi:MAG: hypothetical protein SFU98_01405 [Leptospiraceae bacterium]|nr:hypothetical protein [Leptospiraceae bacterium]
MIIKFLIDVMGVSQIDLWQIREMFIGYNKKYQSLIIDIEAFIAIDSNLLGFFYSWKKNHEFTHKSGSFKLYLGNNQSLLKTLESLNLISFLVLEG